MKNKSVILGIFAVICMVFLVVPVMAGTDVMIQSQNGGITPTFSMSVTGNLAPTITLSVGSNELTSGTPVVNVDSNAPYSISSVDHMKWGKPEGTQGKMVAHSGSAWSSVLASPFQVGIGSGSYVPLSTSSPAVPVTVFTGSAGTYSGNMKFKQDVAYTDALLAGNTAYEIGITVSGGN